MARTARIGLRAAFRGGAVAFALASTTLEGPARADDPQESAFSRAQADIKEGRAKEAADTFHSIALGSSDRPIGERAVKAFIEAEAQLLQNGGEDANGLRSALPKLIELYCKPDKRAGSGDTCDLLLHVDCDITRLEAESRIKAFDKDPEGSPQSAKEAGDIYMSLWKAHGEAPMRAGKPPECNRMDEVLYNAAKSYQAAGMTRETIAARMILLDPKLKFGGSALRQKAVYENAVVYHAIGEYEQAASWYERFARESPKSDRAEDALSDAVVLRLALWQPKEAEDLAGLFAKNYGAKRPEKAGQVAFAIAAYCAERGDFRCAERNASGAIKMLQSGPIDLKMRVLATLGQARAAQNDEAGAEKQYKNIAAMYPDTQAMQKLLRETADSDLRRVGHALNAVGEALFFLAEIERKKATADPLPAYKGPADAKAISKFMVEKTARAMTKRREAIEEVEKRYLAIVNVEPAPPPRWVVAAAAQVAGMWGDLYDQARVIEITGKPAKDSQLMSSVRASLDDALEPFRARAKAAAKVCLNMSVKYQYTSEYSERCAAWLSERFPKEFPRLEELRPKPSAPASGMPRPAPAGKKRDSTSD